MNTKLEKRINRCFYCPYCDDNDIPNLFCKLSNELVDSLSYRYCPMDKKEVVDLIKRLDEENEELKSLLKIFSDYVFVVELDEKSVEMKTFGFYEDLNSYEKPKEYKKILDYFNKVR